MKILDDMGVRKLSAKVFSKANYSFKNNTGPTRCELCLSHQKESVHKGHLLRNQFDTDCTVWFSITKIICS